MSEATSNFRGIFRWPLRFAEVVAGLATAPVRGWVAVIYAIATLATLAVFLQCGLRIAAQTNQDVMGSDQAAYVGLARESVGAPFPHATDGTRNALVPWIAAKFLDPTSDSFFELAKDLNVIFGLVVTAGLAVFFAQGFSVLAAWNLTTISGLGAILGISSFFGGEVLLYPLFFGVWVLALTLLVRPTFGHSALLGFVAALAYLAKPSVGPALLLFGLLTIAAAGLSLFAPATLRSKILPPTWKAGPALLGLALFAVTFLVVAAPRAFEANARFGDPFYNIGKYTFWLDDWDTGFPHMGSFRKDRVMELDESIRPTPAAFYARHGLSGSFQRLSSGLAERLTQMFFPEKKIEIFKAEKGRPVRTLLPHRGVYLALGLLCAAAAIALAGLRGGMPEPASWILPGLYAVGCFCGFLLAFAWFVPVGPGHRFPMMLYIPLLWTGFFVAEQLGRHSGLPSIRFTTTACHIMVAVLLGHRLVQLASAESFGELRYTF